MSEFLGVIIIALAFAVLSAVTPWFRRRQEAWYMYLFLGDAFTIGFVLMVATGVSLVVVQLNAQQAAGNTNQLMFSIAALVVGVPLITYVIRRVLRATNLAS